MMRLAIVASHVIQYQDPFFRLLAEEPDVDLTVLYCSRQGAETYRDEDMKTTLAWDIDLLQGYRHPFLRNLARDNNAGYTRLINPGIVRTRLRARVFPGEDPAHLPPPESVADAFLTLALPECTRNGEILDVGDRTGQA